MSDQKYTQQDLDQINEFDRRFIAGLNPAPLVKKIQLEDIAGKENYARVAELEKLNLVSSSIIRGKELSFITNSKRLLWQAYGQEYIEPELLDFIDDIPSTSTYFDIGASNGVFALYAAIKGISVVCFEPEIANFSLLNHNTYLNSKSSLIDISNFNIALSDENGIGEIYIEKYEAGGHLKILDSDLNRNKTSFNPDFIQKVLKYKLDDFLKLTNLRIPNFLKIDVDGAEQRVLKGMTGLLKNDKLQKIFIELEEAGENFDFCHNIITSNGFKIESRKRVQNYFG